MQDYYKNDYKDNYRDNYEDDYKNHYKDNYRNNYKDDYRNDYRNDYRCDYRDYCKKENHRDFKEQKYKRKHRDNYEKIYKERYNKDNYRYSYKDKDSHRDKYRDSYRDDSYDQIRCRSKEKDNLYYDDDIFDSKIRRVHIILQTMCQEKEMAIGFMLVFSENPDKILDSIHSQVDVECLIAKRIEFAKNQKAEKLAKDQQDHISNTNSQSRVNPLSYEPINLLNLHKVLVYQLKLLKEK